MADSDRLGVVVIGLGIVGKVRIRDILQSASEHPELSKLKLQGFVSRMFRTGSTCKFILDNNAKQERELQMGGVKQCTLEEALADPSVHIVIICTENDQHAPTAQKALEAGKHVLVEFPLALTAKRARELKNLAAEKGLVCYEEDISLLTDKHLHVKDFVKTKTLVEGDSWVEARFNGWIEDVNRGGSAFHSSVPHLHRLLNCFGDVKPVSAKIVREERSVDSEATVQTPDGGLVKIRIQREVLERPKRVTGFSFKFSDNSVIDSRKLLLIHLNPKPQKLGLFLQDLIQFMQVVQGQRDDSAESKITLRSLEIADQLFEMAKNNSDSKL